MPAADNGDREIVPLDGTTADGAQTSPGCSIMRVIDRRASPNRRDEKENRPKNPLDPLRIHFQVPSGLDNSIIGPDVCALVNIIGNPLQLIACANPFFRTALGSRVSALDEGTR